MTGARQLFLVASLVPSLIVAGSDMALAAGAFAFGQNDTHGWSSGSGYNYKSPSDAQDAAMTRCRSRKEAGSYCKVIATINGRCFAIAVQEGGNGYGWNTATTTAEAEKLAMGRCAGYGKSCSVRDSFCDTVINAPPSMPPPAAAPSAPAAPAPPPSSNQPGGGSPACQKFPDLC